jgi:hypothetical protein
MAVNVSMYVAIGALAGFGRTRASVDGLRPTSQVGYGSSQAQSTETATHTKADHLAGPVLACRDFSHGSPVDQSGNLALDTQSATKMA